MGSYRSYMRNDYPEERTSPLTWLLCALVAAFLIQVVLIKVFSAGSFVASHLALSGLSLQHYRLWTLLSYSFLHDPQNLLHILFVLLGLYFIGRDLLGSLGAKRFFTLYGLSALVGGLAFVGVHWNSPGVPLIGASAAVSGIFIVFCCQNPDRPITFLFLFIPITLPKTKYLGYALAALDLFGFVFNELISDSTLVAHSAHLGGMLTGLLFHQFAVRGVRWGALMPWRRSKPEVLRPAWMNKARRVQENVANFQVNITDREHLRAEVDRILDKINSEGFGSLTPAEKKTLDEAKDLLSKN